MGVEGAEPLERRGQPSARAGAGGPAEDDLSQRLADLARDMQRQPDSADVMAVIVSAVVATVPGAEKPRSAWHSGGVAW